MRFRESRGSRTSADARMAPLIDVVFLLLIFFMLTLKIIAPEGEFAVNMPAARPAEPENPPELLPPITIRLKSNEHGQLVSLEMGQTRLGNDEAAFERLNAEILAAVGGDPGSARFDDLEVRIDADHDLDWSYTLKAVSAVRGRLDNSTTPPRVVPYVERITFERPRGTASEPEPS